MKAGRHGFTLIELLAVMAIIAILIGISFTGFSLARRHARESQAKAGIEKLRSALEEYRVAFGRYPGAGHDGDIGALAEADFLKNAVEGVEFIDPWGRPFQYRHAAESKTRFLYSVWSEGQDPGKDSDNIDPSKPGY